MKISFNSFNKYPINISANSVKKLTFKGVEAFDTFQKQESEHINHLSEKFDKPVKIVFSDIDGTMIDETIPYLHGRVYKSILDLKEKNIPLILSTGRSTDEIFSFTEKMPYNPDFFILEQGAYITDKFGRPIYKDPMKKEDAYSVLDFYREYSKENPTAQLLTYINGLMYYLNADEVDEDNLDPKFLKLIYRQFENGNLPTKYLLFFPRSLGYEGMENVKDKAKNIVDADNLSMLITGPHYLEFMNKSSSKGNAAKIIAEKLGFKLENALGIGDGENDIALIEKIQDEGGVGIAMGNAQKCLKDKANFVTDDVRSRGFATAIESVLEHNKQFD